MARFIGRERIVGLDISTIETKVPIRERAAIQPAVDRGRSRSCPAVRRREPSGSNGSVHARPRAGFTAVDQPLEVGAWKQPVVTACTR
jgi:hypothetical protein